MTHGKTAAVNGNGVADTKPAKRKNMASNKEVLGHALGGVGQNTVYALWSGFITAFLYGCIRHEPGNYGRNFPVCQNLGRHQ